MLFLLETWYTVYYILWRTASYNMNSFETEKQFDTLQKKSAEATRESREMKEAEKDPELQAAASKERADYLVKEVKSSSQQMQNIAMHVAQVQQALKKLRAELQLSEQGDSMSVQQDKARIDTLKKQIGVYMHELVAMKEDLITFEMGEIKKAGVYGSEQENHAKAVERVEELLMSLQTEEATVRT